MKIPIKIFIHLLLLTAFIGNSGAQVLSKDYYWAQASFQKGEYMQAYATFQKLLADNPAEPALLISTADALFASGRYLEAITYYEKANKEKPKIASLQLAKCYSELKNAEKMYAYLEEHLKSPYKKAKSSIILDKSFTWLADDKEWNTFWGKNWYYQWEEMAEQLSYLNKFGNHRNSLELLEENVKRNTNRHSLQLEWYKTYVGLKDYQAALSHIEKAIELEKENDSYYYLKAEALINLDKPSRAIEAINQGLDINPFRFDYILLKAELLFEIGEYDQALETVNFYIDFFQDDLSAKQLQGDIHYNNGSYLKALEVYNELLKADSTKEAYFTRRGKTYLKTSMYKFAIKDYSMALDIDPTNADSYVKKGMARHKAGDSEGACYDWKKALQLGSMEGKKYLLDYNCK